MTYMFNKSTLVLESVTLAQVIELMIEMHVNFPTGAVFDWKASENTETAHP